MDDNAPQENPSSGLTKIDLSQLQGFSFGTQWTQDKDQGRDSGHGGEQRRHRDDGGPERRDRRGFKKPAGGAFREGDAGQERRPGQPRRESAGGRTADRDGRPTHRGGPRRDGFRGQRHAEPRIPYESPYFQATFYPEDSSFDTLAKTVRASCRTIELFEIAKTVVAKPERFVVVLQRKPQAGGGGESAGGKPEPIAISVPDGLPFESEDAAVAHVVSKHLDKFFDIAEVEVEPPKGNFQVVNRCGVTGELLGPPNYHRYTQLMQQHHAAKVGRMSFDTYRSKIETLRDPEAIAAWLEKMKKATRYTWKTAASPQAAAATASDVATEAPPASETPPVAEISPAAEQSPQPAEPSVDAPTEATAPAPDAAPAEAAASPAPEAASEPQAPAAEPAGSEAPFFDARHEARAYLLSNSRGRVVRLVEQARMHGKLLEQLPPGEIHRTIQGTLERQRRFPLDTANALRGRLRREGFTIFKKGAKGISYVCAVKRRFRVPGQVFSDSIASLIAFIEAHPNIKAGELPEKFLNLAPVAAPEAAPTEGDASSAPQAESVTLSPEHREQLTRLQGDLRWLVHEGYVTEFIDGGLYAPPVMVEARKREIDSGENDTENFPEAKSEEPASESEETQETAVEEASEHVKPADVESPEPGGDAPPPEAPIADTGQPAEQEKPA